MELQIRKLTGTLKLLDQVLCAFCVPSVSVRGGLYSYLSFLGLLLGPLSSASLCSYYTCWLCSPCPVGFSVRLVGTRGTVVIW